MKATLFAVMTALFVLCNVALAQEYFIRTNGRINLRDAPGLTGDIVETVPSGTVLQVVGEFNRWLQINRNGNEVWMADWVSYTRSDQTQSQPQSSQIDNCCFVDRQCNSDAEWTSGYWAFQNNQCNAPLQSRPEISSQPASTDQSQIDNCCYLDWQCNTDQEWAKGYAAYQIDHCDVPEGLLIEGPADFLSLMKAAINVLRDRAPAWYAYAIDNLDKIRLIPEGNRSSVRSRSRTWTVSHSRAFSSSGERAVIWQAGSMVHEACHVHRSKAGLITGGQEGETACLRVQIEAVAALDPGDRLGFVSSMRHVLANIHKPEYQWWN